MTDSESALLVFAKKPVAGTVKTRLTQLITAAEAAEVYSAFLADAAVQYRDLDAQLRYYIAPGAAENGVDRHAIGMPIDSVIRQQNGDGLGERLANAFRDAFESGVALAAVIGTDHPTLPTVFVERAFRELKSPRRVVIGPTVDGGFYLLGMNEFRPALFAGMTYSRPDVFQTTIARAGEEGVDVVVLPMWYDVDTPASLIRLWKDIRGGTAAPTATRAVLSRIAEAHGWG